ncbi:MAG: pilus assembly protein, partial [Megasphaera sp.]|nr:pilus assembly protein [Megasphaera sp.]
MNLLHKKGQGIVEFGIVLMLAIPFVFGAYFIFILCYDYMTIASLARESVREMSVQTTSADMLTARTNIISRVNKNNNNAFLGRYYLWNPQEGINGDGFIITTNLENPGDPSVMVEIKAQRGSNGLV